MAYSEKLSEKEKEIIDNLNNELAELISKREEASDDEKEFYDSAIDSFISKARVLTISITGVISGDLMRKLEALRAKKPEAEVKKPVVIPKTKYGRVITIEGNLKVSKEERKRFLQDLQLAEDEMKKVKKLLLRKKEKKHKENLFMKANPFLRMSSAVFSSLSISLAEKSFQGLRHNLRKAAMPFLLSGYISLMLFSTLIALISGVGIAIVFAFMSSPKNIAVELARNVAVSFVIPILTFIIFYAYPSSQISSFRLKIENELPFAIMHMSTIAGSGVEPTRVFKIIALSEDYPAISKEARKIMNQINFYGYDFVNALRETAKTTSSEKFAELLNGMATIISSGGNLQAYLEKSSENSLLDYKLKRKSYVETSATFADVYTGILITAPLLFMLLLALINVMGLGIDMMTLGVFGIGGIIVLNIGFLVFLNISQPES